MIVDLHNNGNKKNIGFTLVELVVVIAIIAVLTGVTAPMFMNSMENNRRTTCETNRKNAVTVFEQNLTGGKNKFDLQEFKDTVKECEGCPGQGTYQCEIVGNKAILKCNHVKHTEVVEMFWSGWEGTEGEESTDEELTPP